MSHKYQELAEKYQAEIVSLKRAKARLDQAEESFNAFRVTSDDPIQWDHSEELSREWEKANRAYQIEVGQLAQDIEAEYNDVPFAKARKQGIEKFWKVADI